MSRIHVVKKGETLATIAQARMGGRAHAATLADYNALRTRKPAVGSRIFIPSAADLKPRVVALPRGAAWPPPPVGLQGVLAAFGDLYDFIRDDGTVDPRWEMQSIVRCALPFPIPLDWDPTKSATAIRCHRLLEPLFGEVFRRVVATGLRSALQTYGGCYQFRAKRNGSKPSTHSWGIAIDFNVRSNAMGTAGDMDPRLVELMEGLGFVWGGRWSGANKDPMHFQYCSAY
jgi:hypothetical protein